VAEAADSDAGDGGAPGTEAVVVGRGAAGLAEAIGFFFLTTGFLGGGTTAG
jgi:hypothetical protein